MKSYQLTKSGLYEARNPSANRNPVLDYLYDQGKSKVVTEEELSFEVGAHNLGRYLRPLIKNGHISTVTDRRGNIRG